MCCPLQLLVALHLESLLDLAAASSCPPAAHLMLDLTGVPFCLQLLEIKRLNAGLGALRSELNKFEEQLEDCRKYREFLDSITPEVGFCKQCRPVWSLRPAGLVAGMG